MIAPINTKWTPERVERLKELAGNGGTAAVIAAELGMTRNAVIGKIYRLGLTWKHTRNGAAPKPKRVDHLKFGAARINVFQTVGTTVSARPDTKSRPRKCTLLRLKADSCRFPLGDHEPRSKKFRFCGDKAVEGYPYCPDHCAMAYQAVPERKRNAA